MRQIIKCHRSCTYLYSVLLLLQRKAEEGDESDGAGKGGNPVTPIVYEK